MAECAPPDNHKRKKRQENPCETESEGIDDVATPAQDEESYERKNYNRYQAFVEESEEESVVEKCEGKTPRSDAGEEDVNGQKKRKRRKLFFWRKKRSKTANSDAAIDSDNQDLQIQAEGACAMPSTSGDQSAEASSSSAQPKPSTSFAKWAAKLRDIGREKAETDGGQRQDHKILPPKTIDMPLGPNQRLQEREATLNDGAGDENPEQKVDRKNKKSAAWRHANRILRRSKKPKATSSTENEATTSASVEEVEAEAEEEADDAHDSADLLNDYEHTCAICYEILVRPHTVRPCDHVFCEGCLRQLQHTTASRGPRPHDRRGRQDVEVLVLCPICRGPIQKCEANGGLDKLVRSWYPRAYEERLKVLQVEGRKFKHCKLPGSISRPVRPNQRLQQLLQRREIIIVKEVSKFFGNILIIVGAGSILVVYVSSLLLTVGLFKFGFSCVGQGRRVFDAERGAARSPIKFTYIRALSLVPILGAIALFSTATWRQCFRVNLCVLVCSGMGYAVDGAVGSTLRRVYRACFEVE